jgi:polar amino acid transport system permease protein
MNAATISYIANGALVTAGLAIAAILGSAVVGLLLAMARLYSWTPLRWLTAGWMVAIRGVPLLVLLIGCYFTLPYAGINLPLTVVAIAVMSVYFGAYMAEVFRGAIESVPKTQWDAGRSVGFRWLQTFSIVILPQARRLCVAPFLNTALSVVKNTSLISAIGGWELVAAGREIGDRTGDLLPAYLAIAVAYFLLCFPLSRLAALVEAKTHG